MANGVEAGVEARMTEEDGAASARNAALLMKCLEDCQLMLSSTR